MDDRPTHYLVVNLFVEDLVACRKFYDRIFRAPIVFEDSVSVAFRFHGVTLHLFDAADTKCLNRPVSPDSGANARLMLSMWVDNVDAVFADTSERGLVVTSAPADRPWGTRSFTFLDPAGHCWEVTQSIDLMAATA